MCANIFSWYGGLFYQRASTEEEVVGARDPRRGPININKPTAPDPHHLAWPSHSSIKELLPPGRGSAGVAQQCPPCEETRLPNGLGKPSPPPPSDTGTVEQTFRTLTVF